MNKKSFTLFFLSLGLFFLLGIEIAYLQITKSMTHEELEKKRAFVQLSGLPDLALSNENPSLRHRSLSDVSSIYKEDGSLREYAIATYTISHANTNNEK